MIRPVTSADVSALVAVAEKMHAQSRYAAIGDLDVGHTTALLTRAIQAQVLHGEPGASFLRLAMQDGTPTGAIIGTLERVYHFGPVDQLRATDLLYYNAGNPIDSVHLLDAYLAWAYGQPGVIEVTAGVTDAIGDHRRVAKLYERRGFERFGAIYRKDAV